MLLLLLLLLQLCLGLLLGDLPGSPADHVEVEDGVDDQEEVHGWDGDVVDDAIGEAPELLGVEHSSQDEAQGQDQDGKGGGGQQSVFIDLENI